MLGLVPKLAKPTCLIDSIDNAALLCLIFLQATAFNTPTYALSVHFYSSIFGTVNIKFKVDHYNDMIWMKNVICIAIY